MDSRPRTDVPTCNNMGKKRSPAGNITYLGQTADGKDRWRVRVTLGTTVMDKRQKFWSRNIVGTEKDADKLRRQMLAEVEARRAATGSNDYVDGSVSGVLLAWLGGYSKKHHSPNTHVVATIHINWFIKTIGRIHADKLTAEDIEKSLDKLRKEPFRIGKSGKLSDKGRSEQTVQRYRATLRTAYEWARKQGLVARNPAKDVQLKPIKEAKLAVATVEQTRDMIKWLDEKKPLFGVLARFIGVTGCRRGEALALKWDCVEPLDNGGAMVTFARALVRARHQQVLRESTKTGRDRTIVIDQGTYESVLKLGTADHEYVFSKNPTDPLTLSNVTAVFRQAADAAGISRAVQPVHGLRHALATRLLASGADLNTVMQRGGWEDIGTVNRYLAYLKERDTAAADTMASLYH